MAGMVRASAARARGPDRAPVRARRNRRGAAHDAEFVRVLHQAHLVDDRIEVQLHAWRGRLWVRVSAQVYNDRSDIDRLADAVVRRLNVSLSQ